MVIREKENLELKKKSGKFVDLINYTSTNVIIHIYLILPLLFQLLKQFQLMLLQPLQLSQLLFHLTPISLILVLLLSQSVSLTFQSVIQQIVLHSHLLHLFSLLFLHLCICRTCKLKQHRSDIGEISASPQLLHRFYYQSLISTLYAVSVSPLLSADLLLRLFQLAHAFQHISVALFVCLANGVWGERVEESVEFFDDMVVVAVQSASIGEKHFGLQFGIVSVMGNDILYLSFALF